MTNNPTDTGRKMVPYRKKPVVIEAVQWFKHGDHAQVRKTEVNFGLAWRCEHCGDPQETHGAIITLESGAFAHTVCPGDWIIKGVKGEYYACKPDIFEQTYEAAAPTDTVQAWEMPLAFTVDEEKRWEEIKAISHEAAYSDRIPTKAESALCGAVLRARELEDKLADCRAELEKAKRRSNDMDAQFVRAGRALAEHMRDCCPKCGQRSPIDWCDDDDCPIGSKITESRLAAHAERESSDCWSEGQSHDFVGGKCLRCGKPSPAPDSQAEGLAAPLQPKPWRIVFNRAVASVIDANDRTIPWAVVEHALNLRSHQAPVGEARDRVIEECAQWCVGNACASWGANEIAAGLRALKTPSPQTGEK